ncbi:unnamed protein product [Nippostrongylus brasiliensis]|uniref:Uncharacterized protein n=1 Tax=Nippostrongylus brasiliensis TaxID=27835 RepID=A0A0N4XIL3_NIPBR|nr:unnamed protein product [Nippostrongylus brasiliensis]
MKDMVPKLGEMRSGTSLLACRFPLPDCDDFRLVGQIDEGIDAVRFFLRYPQAPLYIVVAMLCSAMIGPSMHTVYLYLTMSPDEFKRYETERRLVVRERQKYGEYWIHSIG